MVYLVKTITIDPGHGGRTLVPLDRMVYKRKYYTTDFYVLEKALENRGAKVLMTRTTDVDVYGP